MSDMYSNFTSFTELSAARDEKRKAQQLVLQNAKLEFEVSKAKKEKAKRQGEGTWMLKSVSDRISKEEKDLSKAKKKLKKRKKKKRGKRSSSRSSDSEQEEWVEQEAGTSNAATALIKGPQLQRESWMEAPLDLIPTTSRQDIRAAISRNKEEARRAAEKALEPGQHSLELNPYWREGGTGLPQETKVTPECSAPSSSAGDCGFSWLQKAYTRCVQQASDEGRTLEEVAAHRYGSLKNLEKMLAEAKDKMRFPEGHRTKHENFGTEPRRHSEKTKSLERRRERSESEDRRVGRSDSREGRGDIGESKERRREKNESRDMRKREIADHEADRERRRREDSRHLHSEDSRAHRKTRFMRPGDSEDGEQTRLGGRETTSSRSSTYDKVQPRWKKSNQLAQQKPALEPKQCHKSERKSPQHPRDHGKKEKQNINQKLEKRQKSSPLTSSGSSNDDHSSDTGSENEKPDKMVDESHKILSEEELNDLAAEILRAEIMGNEDVATELKSKLEAARHQRTASTSGSDFSHRRHYHRQQDLDEEGGDDLVVLSRTSKGGMVRPVGGPASQPWGGKSGKKRKKTAVTHDSAGERSIYFEDDHKFDLKALVEQEKSGTAEDQNAMFSRLSGRSNDRDLDVDDMFVSKAARMQDEHKVANRDRAAAILEHRKVSAAMDKCHRCFDRIPKHLIIAIGTKSYLCLPPHRSLTEGHCLIVPMHHSSSCTAIDEDVWREMQVFRKSLVQMFLSQGEDVVVMETVMHLKRFPHTTIECIPLEKELGDLAPIYFKKAIQEAGPEWADNKKLHSLREKDVRHVIPKGFPYFSVDFGLQGGFATVIEDEETFPSYFGREVVGGMLDAEPALWRKPHQQSFEDQRKKVVKFEQIWREFDWTQSLNV